MEKEMGRERSSLRWAVLERHQRSRPQWHPGLGSEPAAEREGDWQQGLLGPLAAVCVASWSGWDSTDTRDPHLQQCVGHYLPAKDSVRKLQGISKQHKTNEPSFQTPQLNEFTEINTGIHLVCLLKCLKLFCPSTITVE